MNIIYFHSYALSKTFKASSKLISSGLKATDPSLIAAFAIASNLLLGTSASFNVRGS